MTGSPNVTRVRMADLAATEPAVVAAFESWMWDEASPNEPPLAEEVAIWLATRERPNATIASWVVREPDDGGAIAGVGNLRLSTTDNLHLGIVDLRVRPEHRRRGIGTALLRAMAEHARDADRTTLMTWSWDLVPDGEHFASALGATAGQVIRRGELDLRSLDRALVARWLDVPADVRERYELVEVTGPYPTDQYDEIAEIEAVMDTAPRDGLDVEDHVFDADWVAQREQQQADAPGDRWTTFVRDRDSGRFVGFTQVFFYDDWPGHVDQGNTGVHPDHRGHGLGRWLKAAMVDRIFRERPDSNRVWTTNAFSNAPMLAINDEMGFVVVAKQTTWQAGVAEVLRSTSRG